MEVARPRRSQALKANRRNRENLQVKTAFLNGGGAVYLVQPGSSTKLSWQKLFSVFRFFKVGT